MNTMSTLGGIHTSEGPWSLSIWGVTVNLPFLFYT